MEVRKELTFKQFLAEKSPEEFQDFLATNCKPYFEKVGDPLKFPMYRGTDNPGKPIELLIDGVLTTCFIRSPRTDRSPLDTSRQLTQVIDTLFENKFGWRPRSTGTFAYGKFTKSAVTMYGDSYQIIPIGNFSYLWNPNIPDLTPEVRKLIRRHYDKSQVPIIGATTKYTPEQVDTLIPGLSLMVDGYQDTGLKKAITGPTREIMLKCDSYLLIPTGHVSFLSDE